MTKRTKHRPTLTVQSLTEQLAALAQRRESWEQNDFTKSNSTLYGLLGDCLDIYNATLGKRTLALALNSYLQEVGLGSNSNPSLQLRIVRAVFVQTNAANKHDARLLGYAKVIKVAAEKGCKGPGMAKFISENHGIDAIRRWSANGRSEQPHKRARDTREFAIDILSRPEATAIFKGFTLPASLQPSADHRFSVAIVRKEADGTGTVVFGMNSAAAVNCMLTIAGRQLEARAEQLKTQQKLTDQAAEEQVVLDNLEQLVAASKRAEMLASA